MTRVSLFFQKNTFQFESWEGASEEFENMAENVTISVLQGRNINYADLTIQCKSLGLTLTFSLCDLWQDGSSMLDSISQTIEEYDFWDTLPPFGVVHLYNSRLTRQENIADEDLVPFFTLLDHFLLKHFMMYVFYENEVICPYMIDRSGMTKTFVHNGQRGYRNKNY